ncbi:MAG TPA: Maf family nucleotide pyrophosphatase [Burkholderiales bacterium]|nr:Maf family nucleotide pyrophosphatase [Burkholderiales bacterium]
MSTPRLVLASSSPYRRQLLERLKLPFEVRAPAVDETALPGESARETALRLAEAKARAVARGCPDALIIGSDQTAVLDGTRLGKPGSRENALAQLRAMRGRSVLFHTALALLNVSNGAIQREEVPTLVQLRHYRDEEIERYLALEQPYDCAGAARIEGLGIALVERVASEDPSALIGLPLIALAAMLRNEGVLVP